MRLKVRLKVRRVNMVSSFYRQVAKIASPGGNRGKLQIFIFHRVLDKPDPLSPGEPDTLQFEKIISMVSNIFNVIPLGEAIEKLATGNLPGRAACITFDDGYIDNYTNAFPILKKYKAPATIFIATDFIGGEMMWNDIVIESIRKINEPIIIEELGLVDSGNINDEYRISTIQKIIGEIKHLPPLKRAEFVSLIQEKTGFEKFSLMMNEEQLLGLHNEEITLGAHTRSHPILKSLNDLEARKEIGESKEILEALLKDTVSLFAYPNGRPGEDYTARDVDIVSSIGFKAAVSTEKRVANRTSSIYEVPRFTPWDTNIDKFMLRSLLENYRA